MSKVWVAVIAASGGLIAGLMIAKVYAQQTIKTDISNTLGKVGLAGGVVEQVADAVIVPQ